MNFNNEMLQDLNTLCYIQEQTSFEEDYGNNFGYTVEDRGSRFYVIFDAVLQSFGIKNRNGREYNFDNIWKLITTDPYIQDMLRKNSWLGEINHPAAELKGEDLTMNRIANPDMTKTSHYIRNPRRDGNLLKATIQTDSSNENGMNMAIKIVDGKIIPCFSARVLGALRNIMDKMIVYVTKLVTYDWVLYPSHPEAEALISQPHLESVQSYAEQAAALAGAKVVFLKELAQAAANNSKECEMICEAFNLSLDDVIGLTDTGNSVVIAEKSNIYIQPLSDKLIRSKTQNAVKNWLNS